ncbi:hypothetical protein NUW54_g8085 [Trametes sanguinea]|uniref:Uncharacterized protein n=1 Tax=Trametes sanguinea TaxID=158606 RepID=A0ACC1PFU8_9APHY|nr:hypothetical protein NUW54_g8085 [Trametes sanguinea]
MDRRALAQSHRTSGLGEGAVDEGAVDGGAVQREEPPVRSAWRVMAVSGKPEPLELEDLPHLGRCRHVACIRGGALQWIRRSCSPHNIMTLTYRPAYKSRYLFPSTPPNTVTHTPLSLA